jgi:hypothetical protein
MVYEFYTEFISAVVFSKFAGDFSLDSISLKTTSFIIKQTEVVSLSLSL